MTPGPIVPRGLMPSMCTQAKEMWTGCDETAHDVAAAVAVALCREPNPRFVDGDAACVCVDRHESFDCFQGLQLSCVCPGDDLIRPVSHLVAEYLRNCLCPRGAGGDHFDTLVSGCIDEHNERRHNPESVMLGTETLLFWRNHCSLSPKKNWNWGEYGAVGAAAVGGIALVAWLLKRQGVLGRAVHGLNPFSKDQTEHAFDTWRKPSGRNGRLWLRDDLPNDLPDSRIFLYEYSADAVYGSNRGSFVDCANNFLEELTQARRKARERPLLLLGHSLGGLLIKQALNIARHNERHTPIKNATVGIAFFGTPHDGGNEAQIVPKESAQIGLPGNIENIVMLAADHSNICKFDEGRVDRNNYKLVKGNLEELYEKALGLDTTTEERNLECLRCLSSPDWECKRSDRVRGTCEWILQADELQKWLGTGKHPSDQPASRVLWLYGNPGTGKTTMAATVVEELPEQQCFQDKSNLKLLAYFFCNSNSEHQKTATSLLQALIYQFIEQQRRLVRFAQRVYKKRKEDLQSLDQLWSILMEIGCDSASGEKYCVIDALDECDYQSRKDLLGKIKETFKDRTSQDSRLKISFLIFSREHFEIRQKLRGFVSKDLASYPRMAEDLRAFIDNKVEELQEDNGWLQKTADEVVHILQEKAEGTFLWVGMACSELVDARSRDAVQKLQELPSKLHSLYQKLSGQVLTNIEGRRDYKSIRQIIDVVLISRRPLTVLELAEACQLHQDEDHPERTHYTTEAIEMWRQLLVIRNNTVQLLHSSVRDFLLGPQTELPIDQPEAHASMANRCIEFLSRAFEKERLFEPPPKADRFFEYAVLHWARHASLAQGKFSVIEHTEQFFQAMPVVQSGSGYGIEWRELESWLKLYRVLRPHERISTRCSIFHVAAQWGIAPLVPLALRQISKHTREQRGDYSGYDDTEFVDEGGVTPLQEAARHGRTEIMKILLENALPAMQITASVVEAAARNHSNAKELMELLLDRRPDQVQVTQTVLENAAGNRGQGKKVMELLMEKLGDGIQITENVVKAAAANSTNGKDVMTLFLNRLRDRIQITTGVLEVAARNRGNGKEVIALLLNQAGNRIQITQDLIRAAAGNEGKGQEVTALLMEHLGRRIRVDHYQYPQGISALDGDADFVNRWGLTALHAAAWDGNIQAVEQLLARGACRAALSASGWTPLDIAVAKGHIEIIRLLAQGHDAGAESAPTCLSGVKKSDSLELDNDRIEVNLARAIPPGVFHAAGKLPRPGCGFSVLADKPISLLEDSFAFEIEVIDPGDNRFVGPITTYSFHANVY
ncbi:hypothetical protein BJX61DRAFT_547746 [Aspergillus egyptiacus]|nr:hypothetical protein BJX61DRAFT_547746 [Aspergillus egyptiacus]